MSTSLLIYPGCGCVLSRNAERWDVVKLRIHHVAELVASETATIILDLEAS